MNWINNLPKPFRIIIKVLLVITLVYYIVFLVYLFLKYFRIFMAYIFDESRYWTFVICLLMILVSFLIWWQINYDVFGELWEYLCEKVKQII